MAADKSEYDDDTVSEKASGSVWVGVCVCGCVCLLARARMCQNWLCCGKHIQRQTGHLFALIPQCCGVHWLVVLRDRRATLRA